MKTLFKRTIATALLGLCFNVAAQEQIFSTVKNAYFEFKAIVQTTNGGTNDVGTNLVETNVVVGTNVVRITNKDILAALNATGDFNFDKKAKLLLRSVEAGIPFFVVRESAGVGTNNEVDVSDTLIVNEPDDAVHGRNSMVNWGIWNCTLNGGGGTDFNFFGLTVLHTGVIRTGNGGKLLRTVNLSSTGSGPGHLNGATAQFSGRIFGNHARLD